MKKILCLALALLLTLSAAGAIELEYTLPEKFGYQVDFGSGVKGSVNLYAEGSAEWLNILLPFCGPELEIRYIQSKTNDDFQGRLYALNDEEQERGVTWLYGNADQVYFSSELAPDALLTLPVGGDLLDALLGGDAQNPTIYSALQAALEVDAASWEKAVAPYEAAVELWLANYAAEPVISRTKDGTSCLTARYEVPAAAVKAEIKVLMASLLKDQAMLSLLRPLMSATQQATYLNPQLQYYYNAVIDALPLRGEVEMVRTLSTMGEVLGTSIMLPLPDSDSEWTGVEFVSEGDDTVFMLHGQDKSIALQVEEKGGNAESNAWEGKVQYLPEEGEKLSVSFTLSKTHTTAGMDEKEYTHEYFTWQFKAQPDLSHLEADDEDRADYADFEPVEAELKLHFYSRSMNVNPTSVEIDFQAKLPEALIRADGKIKTANDWAMPKLPVDGAENVLTLSEGRTAELLESFIQNAAVTMLTLTATPEPIAEPEETPEPATGTDLATPADLATKTDMNAEPDAAQTPVPPME